MIKKKVSVPERRNKRAARQVQQRARHDHRQGRHDWTKQVYRTSWSQFTTHLATLMGRIDGSGSLEIHLDASKSCERSHTMFVTTLRNGA
jgi:hypothetical protein